MRTGSFEELHGIPADIGEYTDAGMTDPDVGAKTFSAILHRDPTPHELAQLIQRRLEHLSEAVAESEGYKLLPGVPERLRQLSHEGQLLGIIAGNGDGEAYIKLARRGHNVPNTEIHVIGDTPLDIEAAHAVGCTAIAVATGHYDRAALLDAGADHVLATLDEELPID